MIVHEVRSKHAWHPWQIDSATVLLVHARAFLERHGHNLNNVNLTICAMDGTPICGVCREGASKRIALHASELLEFRVATRARDSDA